MKDNPFTSRSLTLYATLQSLALAFCWGWFAVWGLIALTGFQLGEPQFWLLFGSACAGLYGLRPNLERAIDKMWLGDKTTPAAVSEIVAQLKPVKRRIDIAFSLVILAAIIVFAVVWGFQMLQTLPAAHT